MKEHIENDIRGHFALTNHLVGNGIEQESYKSNHLAQAFVGHIDNYKIMVEHLLLRTY